jgi:FkbM family methyltransferase
LLHLLRVSARAGVLVLARFLRALLPGTAMAILKENLSLVERMDYAPKPILLNIESRLEHDIRVRSCAKEPETIEWIEKSFKSGDVFYDIGANVGVYSLVAAKANSGGVLVYAFEPAFINYSQLCQNIYLNGSADSIVPLPIALSDETSIESLNYQNLIPGGALHALGQPTDYKGDVFAPVFKQKTLGYKLDDFVRLFGIKPPNHIKIDVDGIEAAILRGAEEIFRSSSIRSVLVEVEEGRSETTEVVEFLKSNGLEFRSKHSPNFGTWPEPYVNAYNYIFERKN